jgi:hypothetical protein
VSKPVQEGRICRWLFLFQESDFDVIVKPGKTNVRLDHLSKIEIRGFVVSLDDQLPNSELFKVEAMFD